MIYQGEKYKSLTSLCKSLKIYHSTVMNKMKKGMTMEEAIEDTRKKSTRYKNQNRKLLNTNERWVFNGLYDISGEYVKIKK